MRTAAAQADRASDFLIRAGPTSAEVPRGGRDFGSSLCYPVFSCVETRTMHNPTGSAQQVLPLLQSAKNPLRYLTPNDWALIIDRAKRLSFKKDEKLVSQGKQARTLYVLAAGKVSITVSATRIAQIGPGEICGEMAFLEDSIASATATAEGEVEAYALEWSILQDLFELFPHLASRFYRSVAVNLSRRLREQIVSK